VSLQRVKKAMDAQTIPLLGLFAAFCFVIMMFNLPLPGGTTGHAVGMGMASIILGPWVSMLAISMALLVQALFFGDGGITAFGANCFNMAIVGSLVAYVLYRLIAYRANITATRRVIAAAISGYAAINAAAFCAAVEFGIQPLLFHTANGVPLYAPYPLSIAIPAMMIGHLTFAGLAEAIISGGIVGYLQRADPAMLHRTAPDAPPLESGATHDAGWSWATSRKLWLGLALAIVLTPLGIVAVGSAWGEWSAEDFSDAATRQQIAAASKNQSPPQHAPSGLERLSSLWKAPVPDYAPSFIKSPSFGYFVSAMIGVALIIVLAVLADWLARFQRTGKRRKGFVERTMEAFVHAAHDTLFAEDIARRKGLLQSWDARVKLVGIAALIVGVIALRRIEILIALFALAVLLAAVSRVSLALLAKRVWIPVLLFTGAIALPAIFLVPGDVIYRLPELHWAITSQGVTSACFLLLRAEAAASFVLLLIWCTPWNRLLRALRFFRIPASLIVILEMTYRYLFVLLRTSQDMIESRQARLVGALDIAEQRRIAAAMAGVLLDKSLHLSSEVFESMRARGFRGDVRLLSDARLRPGDWMRLAVMVSVAIAAIWIGR
jgi:cobalt/nickel transport system permease protein